MTVYKLTIPYQQVYQIEVRADNPEEANEKGWAKFDDGTAQPVWDEFGEVTLEELGDGESSENLD